MKLVSWKICLENVDQLVLVWFNVPINDTAMHNTQDNQFEIGLAHVACEEMNPLDYNHNEPVASFDIPEDAHLDAFFEAMTETDFGF